MQIDLTKTIRPNQNSNLVTAVESSLTALDQDHNDQLTGTSKIFILSPVHILLLPMHQQRKTLFIINTNIYFITIYMIDATVIVSFWRWIYVSNIEVSIRSFQQTYFIHSACFNIMKF